jgi:hypothetical protein
VTERVGEKGNIERVKDGQVIEVVEQGMVEEAIIEGEVVEVAVKVDEETGKIVHHKVDSQGNELA